MKRILSVEEMSRADENTIEMGLPSCVLMERAALCVMEEILTGNYDLTRVLVLCGPGNNGGDGAAIARLLAERGILVELFLFGNPQKRSSQLTDQLKLCECYRIPRVEEYQRERYTLVIDAVFGIGLKREISGVLAELFEKINQDELPVIAVDIPSGVDGNSGHVLGSALKCKCTVTFAAGKKGHFLYPGRMYCGEVKIKKIGIPVEDTDGKLHFIEDSDLDKLPKRDANGNKGSFGKLLVIAGSKEICGAAYFSAAAALKSGIGMVKILTHEKNRSPLASLLPEALLECYGEEGPDEDALFRAIQWADGVLAGPGLGTQETGRKILEILLQQIDKPIVFDADALNIISTKEEYWEKQKNKCTITPHAGEMSRLTGKSIREVKENPLETALSYAKEHELVCILKDAATVIAYPNGRAYINRSGCSALATAGSGDVLAGMTAAYRVRFKDSSLPLEALAVHVHGRLGEMAAEEKSESAAIAGDFLDMLKNIRY